MGAAAGPIGAVTSIASIGMSAFGQSEQAAGTQAADNYQAARAQQAAEYAQTAAAQTDAQSRENLNITLGNIDAVRAASGADPSSPTTAAIRDQTSVLGNRARLTSVDNILAQSYQDTSDAAYLTQAGSYAMSMGDLNAASTVLGGVAKTNFSSFGMPS